MLRGKFIDDEAEDDEQESQEDQDDVSETDTAALEADEAFVVDVVARRFGFQPDQFNLSKDLAGHPDDTKSLVVGQSSDSCKLRGQCSEVRSTDRDPNSHRSRQKPCDSKGSDFPNCQSATLDIGSDQIRLRNTTSGGRSKKLRKTTFEPVVSTTLQERIQSSQLKKAVSSSSTEVPSGSNAAIHGSQEISTMDTTA